MRRWIAASPLGPLLIIGIAAFLSACAAFPHKVYAGTTIEGTIINCASLPRTLDEARYTQNMGFFFRWTAADYAVARQLVKTCAPDYSKSQTAHRLADLAYFQHKQSAERAAAQSQAEQWRVCSATRTYQRYAAGATIVQELRSQRYWEHVLHQEQRVGRISGVINMQTEHTAGLEILQARDAIAREWSIYTHAGGTAADPQMIPAGLPDPCLTQPP